MIEARTRGGFGRGLGETITISVMQTPGPELLIFLNGVSRLPLILPKAVDKDANEYKIKLILYYLSRMIRIRKLRP